MTHAMMTMRTCEDRKGPGFFKFMAKTAVKLTPGKSRTFGGRCFDKIEAKLIEYDDSFVIHYNLS